MVNAPGWGTAATPPLERGESISVSGCCLTLAEHPGADARLSFDVVPETLARTTLGTLRAGSGVNLERSVTPLTLLGGHLVQGHVDGTGVVDRIDRGDGWRVRVSPGRELMEYVAPKGSIAVEGVSLTIAALEPGSGWFEVALIPTTLAVTTLGELRAGHRVNIECDIVVKSMVHWMRHYSGGRGL